MMLLGSSCLRGFGRKSTMKKNKNILSDESLSNGNLFSDLKNRHFDFAMKLSMFGFKLPKSQHF